MKPSKMPNNSAPLRSDRDPSYLDLSRNQKKIALYDNETEACESIHHLWNKYDANLLDIFYDIGVVVMKPEAILSGASFKIIQYLLAHDFIVIGHAQYGLTRNMAHSIWRYQWNAATADRVLLHTLVGEMTDWVAIYVQNIGDRSVPASIKLWGLKGSSKAEYREADHLRSQLGMRNRMLGFVHTPDEPADIVRELGIVFPEKQREEIVDSLIKSRGRDVSNEIQPSIAQYEKQFLGNHVLYDEIVNKPGLSKVLSLFVINTEQKYQRKPSLKEIFKFVRGLEYPLSDWDTMVIAAELLQHDKPGVEPILDAGSYQDICKLWHSQNSSV